MAKTKTPEKKTTLAPYKTTKTYYKVVRYQFTYHNSNKIWSGGFSGNGFDYTPYFPKSRAGKPTPKIAANLLAICSTGYHITTNPKKWATDSQPCRVFVARALGRVRKDSSDKICAQSIQLVRELKFGSRAYKKVMDQ
jgi:hypothetical protein